MRASDPETGLFQNGDNRIQPPLDGADAIPQRIDFVKPPHLLLVDHRDLAAQLLNLGTQLVNLTHVLRRSFATLGDLRAVSEARPAPILVSPQKSCNVHMEAAVPKTQPPLPTREALTEARRVAGNPAAFAREPDFIVRINTAWWTLKADQLARKEARRAADALRATMPDDAA